ncbi:MAG: hypothetical protein NT051_06960 [Candidatus Micrarchaeota archaeon]|nr:hypothetical protein [Candidatus Micrarchaeota archaeon]
MDENTWSEKYVVGALMANSKGEQASLLVEMMRYTPKGMEWDAVDTFILFSQENPLLRERVAKCNFSEEEIRAISEAVSSESGRGILDRELTALALKRRTGKTPITYGMVVSLISASKDRETVELLKTQRLSITDLNNVLTWVEKTGNDCAINYLEWLGEKLQKSLKNRTEIAKQFLANRSALALRLKSIGPQNNTQGIKEDGKTLQAPKTALPQASGRASAKETFIK